MTQLNEPPPPVVPGALVQWVRGPGEPFGEVRTVNGNIVTVALDRVGEQQFALSSGVLERVTLPPRVRRRSSGERGILIAPVPGPAPRWSVLFASGEKVVGEGDLRPDEQMDPISRLRYGNTGTGRDFALRSVARSYQVAHLHNLLVSLADARVDLRPHQVSVVHRVVTNYPHRFLLCDEVGLGKTIEAAMIIKELRARGSAKRVLVIVPPSLVRQWQFELKTKFNEPFAVLNRDTVRYLASQNIGGNPFAHYDSVIVSAAWAADPARRTLITEIDWDAVIVDEAHHARSQRRGNHVIRTQLYELVRDLAAPEHFSKRSILFLTATPLQLHRYELYSLIEMLDPALFPTEERFHAHLREIQQLSPLVRRLRTEGWSDDAVDADEVLLKAAAFLGRAESAIRREFAERGVLRICDELASKHLLSEIMIRNRKAEVGNFTPRTAARWSVDLTPAEDQALAAVELYVTDGYNRASETRDNATGFVMTVFQRLMASSVRALRTSLAGRRDRLAGRTTTSSVRSLDLDEVLDEDEDVANAVSSSAAAPNEVSDLDRIIALLDDLPTDSKVEALLSNLDIVFGETEGEKVLIFTEFRETQAYLAHHIRERGWSVHTFHGQMSATEKDESVERFRTDTSSSVLVSTEAGGEGRNFQFCHIIINYDLPWNPMRVEQRIGRVDRIGQTREVQVFNLWVKGTIEERILDVLERRINVFVDTVGALEPILGDTERDLRRILRAAREQRETLLNEYEEALAARVAAARRAEVQLRDFVMDTKSFARGIAQEIVGRPSPVTPESQETFMRALLASVRTYIQEVGDGEYRLTFNEPFLSDYPEHTSEGRIRRVVFRADCRRDTEHVQYMAFGHAVIDSILDRVLSDGFPGSGASFVIGAEDAPVVGEGFWFNYVLTVTAVESRQEFVPLFVHADGTVDEALGQSLLAAATSFPRTGAAPPVPVDALDNAVTTAEEHIGLRLEAVQADAAAAADEQSQAERTKMRLYFDYRQRAACDRVDATRATLERLEGSVDQETRRIIPVWKTNLERDQRILEELDGGRERRLADIDRRSRPQGDYQLVNAAWVVLHGELP